MSRSTDRSNPLAYTISHFKKIARQNLFAENRNIAHDQGRCAICSHDIAGRDAFPVYLDVIVESVLVRRPRLDEALVAEINRDRAMAGLKTNVTLRQLILGDPDALDSWVAWVRDALAAGLGLLSIHSPTSLDFDLDEQAEKGHGPLIESRVRHIIDHQKAKNSG
ncbi:MAG: hypothetical protein ABSE08_06210 [Syntrophobacteraceae bacterium]